jgi:hypothetical protein
LILKHPSDEIAKLPTVVDGVFFARHQLPITLPLGGVVGEGVVNGIYSTDTAPVGPGWVAGVGAVVQFLHPRAVRRCSKNSVALSSPEILAEISIALKSWKLICLSIDIGIDFLPLQSLFALPGAGLILDTVFELQEHLTISGAVLSRDHLTIEAQSPVTQQNLLDVVELRGAGVIFEANNVDFGIWDGGETSSPEASGDGFARLEGP